jgi:DNA-binding NarL/FixJ family response regulator
MTHDRPYRRALSPEEARDQLRADARAGKFDGDAVAAVLEGAGQGRTRASDLRPAGLSDREVEVLRLVAAGYSNPEIARLLHVSRRTAEHHVQHIYAKIGVATRPGAALFALQHDLLG